MTDDPFAALEEAAKRKMAEKDAGDAIQAALVRLILGRDAKSPFFATLALRLKLKTDWDCPTAMTDGRSLGYNPGWIADLDLDQTIGLLAHEVLHCAGKHFARRGAREPSKWNVAIDLEINPMLREAGFTLPADGVFPGEGPHKDLPKGEAAERYYDLLPDPPSEEQDGEGEGPGQNPDPGGCGGVKDAGDKAEQQQAAAEMEVAVTQAAEAAKQRGALPGGLNRLVQEIVNPKVDWRETLREYVSSCARNDYSWSPPNRRLSGRRS
jgi:predicted metal-dependent peptidase